MTRPARGPDGFDQHYASIFGARWTALRQALLDVNGDSVAGRVVRENAFASLAARGALRSRLRVMQAPGCLVFERGMDVAGRDGAGLAVGYVMDFGSVLAARALPLEGALAVLDMCAAPGGKALILAENLASGAQLTLNDRSPERRLRLKQVLRDYLPDEVRSRVTVTGHDARRFGVKRPAAFDAVLLDAPCSSEGHVLRDKSALEQWSLGRIERLSREQYALITSALGALKPGGALLYSTCALAPEENDGVIARLLERGRHPVLVEPVRAPLGAPTLYGWQLLPDETGFGPSYFSLLRKPAC